MRKVLLLIAALTIAATAAPKTPLFAGPPHYLCTATATCSDGSTVSCGSTTDPNGCFVGAHAVQCNGGGPVVYCPECIGHLASCPV